FVLSVTRSTPSRRFPYTTLFRSRRRVGAERSHRSPEVGGAALEADPGAGVPAPARALDRPDGPLHERPKGPLRYGKLDADLVTADRKSTRLNSSHVKISYAVFCL